MKYVFDEKQILDVVTKSTDKLFAKEIMREILGGDFTDALAKEDKLKFIGALRTVLCDMLKSNVLSAELRNNRKKGKGQHGSSVINIYSVYVEPDTKKSAKDFFLSRRGNTVYSV